MLIVVEKNLLLNVVCSSCLFNETFMSCGSKIFITIILGLKGAKTYKLHVHGDKELKLLIECIGHLVFGASFMIECIMESVNKKYPLCMHSL